MLKLFSGLVGAAVPWLPIALNVAPWLLLAGAVSFAGIEHLELAAALANVTVAQDRTQAAIAECQLEAQTAAATENAETARMIARADAQRNAAEVALRSAQIGEQARAVVSDNAVTQEARLPGHDAASAPVLLNLSKALMQAPGQ